MNNNIEQNINCIEEDEIDLKELWQTILKGKKIILLITTIVTTITLIYTLKLPNIYKSEAVLTPSKSSGSSMGSLGGLASLAGINIGGGGNSMGPETAFNSLLNNYEFMKKFVVKNRVIEHYEQKDLDKNYVFALGYRGIYELFKSDNSNNDLSLEDKIFNTVKLVKDNLSISSDKKSGLISVSYSDADRFYPPVIIDAFLKDASEYLVENNLANINSQLKYFETELNKTDSIELRQSLSAMISKLIQDKVMMKAKEYYQCDVFAKPAVSYVKDKVKPKRALILIVSFITSIILGVFLVFFLEFIRSDNEQIKQN